MSEAVLDGLTRASIQGGILALAVWVLLRIPTVRRFAGGWIWIAVLAKFGFSLVAELQVPILPAKPLPTPTVGYSTDLPLFETPVPASNPWPQILVWLWAAGLLAVSTRAIMAQIKISRLVRESEDAAPETLELTKSILGRPVRVKVHPKAPVPLLAGLLKPTILLPTGLEVEVSREELSMVLAHEVAHIQRRDLAAGLAAFLCYLPFFFHPAAWLARREWMLAGESACDRIAIRSTNASPRAYAEMLIKISSRARTAPAHALSIVPVVKTLHRRIENMKNPTKSLSRLGLAIVALTATALALPLAFVPRIAPIQEALRKKAKEEAVQDREVNRKRAIADEQITREKVRYEPAKTRQREARVKEENLRFKEKVRGSEAQEKRAQIARDDEIRQAGKYRADLARAAASGQITKREAELRLREVERFTKVRAARGVEVEEDLIQKYMKEGKLTREQAIEKVRVLRAQEEAIGRKTRVRAIEDDLKRSVELGQITKDQAELKMREVTRFREVKLPPRPEDIELQIRRVMNEGKLTREQAVEKLRVLRLQEAATRKEVTTRDIEQDLKRAVEAGQLTKEDAQAKMEAIRREQTRANHEKYIVDRAIEIERLVKDGKITKEEAARRLEELKKKERIGG